MLRQKTFCTALCAALVLAGTASAEFKRIRTAEEHSKLIGIELQRNDGGWLRWNADGTLDGQIADGRAVEGGWEWRDGYLCRWGSVEDKALGEDCQTIYVDGTFIRYIRSRGGGQAGILRMK